MNVYLNSMFRMYNGERKQIELICENDLMDATVFYSWVFGFGGKVSIKAPKEVKDEYAKMVFAAANALNG